MKEGPRVVKSVANSTALSSALVVKSLLYNVNGEYTCHQSQRRHRYNQHIMTKNHDCIHLLDVILEKFQAKSQAGSGNLNSSLQNHWELAIKVGSSSIGIISSEWVRIDGLGWLAQCQ